MKDITNKIKTFFADEKGAETVEWVLVAAILVAIVGVVYGNLLLHGLENAMNNLVTAIGQLPAG